MFDRYYQRRLGADLEIWVKKGWVQADAAAAIRAHAEAGEGRLRLPSVLGALGALLIAASLIAFVAANWEAVPRLAKVALVFAVITAAHIIAWLFAKRGYDRAADSATTFAALAFGGGVALIGQIYHLPADWPGGALLVALGALVAAFLGRSQGALVVACAALGAWTFGRLTQEMGAMHLAFWPLFAVAAWLAASRPAALARHAVVLLLALHLGAWLIEFPLPDVSGSADWSRIAIGLGLAAMFASAGFALTRSSPAFGLTLAHWSIWIFAGLLVLVHLAAHETGMMRHDSLAFLAKFVLLAGAVLALAQMAVTHDRRAGALLVAAMLAGLAIPAVLVLLTGSGAKIVASVLTLASIVGLIGAGILAGSRPIAAAGYTAFGCVVIVLLYRTVGTLLDQSLFFLAAGLALIALGYGARRLMSLARAHRPPQGFEGAAP